MCTLSTPSECRLQINVTELKYNYARRIEGKNQCKFSFSVYPIHSAFKFVEWSRYLKLNITSDYLIP